MKNKEVLARVSREDFIAENLTAGSHVYFILPLRNLRGV
jgi:hypothetical protein